MLFKGLTTSMAAIAIAFAGLSASPARADNDTAKIIAGVAALAIIGAAISENRKDRRQVSRYYNRPAYNPYYTHHHQRKAYRKHYYRHHYGHGHGHRHHKYNHYGNGYYRR
ncbi:MAG: hypothetical protein AAF280_00520 [Pseudomonadota bacterium]